MRLLRRHNKLLFKYISNYDIIRKLSASTHEWVEPVGTDTSIVIYNCIAKRKVPLILKNNIATWYSCGPTVYDSAHIGHASCYVKLDIVQRILMDYFRINLVTSMGVTDIDDKIINRSVGTNKKPQEISTEYEFEFWKNMSELGVTSPNIITRVTEHIPTIEDFITKIMEKKLGYVSPDKSIYFDTNVYGNYGKLQNAQHSDEESDSINKRSKTDFALWKAHKPEEPYWETKWGKGRPGWHIECSAMASRLFGSSLDFHAGGIDLQFPHHENEEAQSCAHHGNNQWVNYWLHTGHLHVKGDIKMSKSLKNTISIDELLKTHNAATFRMACLLSHYTHSMEYCEDLMKNSRAVLAKFKYFTDDCKKYLNNNRSSVTIDENILLSKLDETKQNIDKYLRDDFDTAKSVANLMNLMNVTGKMLKSQTDTALEEFKPMAINLILQYVQSTMKIFGIEIDKDKIENSSTLPIIIDTLVDFRHSVRVEALKSKQTPLLSECDKVRNVLTKCNIKINDKPNLKSTWIYTE